MLKRIHGVGRDPKSSATSGNSWPRGCRGPRLAQWPMALGELGRGRKRPGPGQAQAWREKHLLWAFLPPRPRSPC